MKRSSVMKAIVMVLASAALVAFSTDKAHARTDTGPGFYWVCDQSTGEYVCGYSSPYGHCQYETWNGEIGYLSTGERLVGWYYDCREYMPNGPNY